MIVDHRTYTLFPGTIVSYMKLYEDVGYPLQSKYLGAPLGYFTSMDIGELNQVVHLWGYTSLNERAEKRAKLLADPEWKAFSAQQTLRIMHMENKILIQAPFIPLRVH
ncbi:MAG: NIPSNAP family protein [Alphaproteobacteria bacterium]